MVSGNEIPIAPLASAGSLSMLTSTGEVRPLEEMENEIIRFAISHYRGQMSEVARRLKIGRSTLYRKLDEAAGQRSRRRHAATPIEPIEALRDLEAMIRTLTGTFEPWLRR